MTARGTKSRHKRRALEVPKLDDSALVKWEDTHSNTLALNITEARLTFCKKATDAEVMLFLRTAANLHANPFLNEIFLIKYSDTDPAAIVTGLPFFLGRAANNPRYQGYDSGLLDLEGKPINRIAAAQDGAKNVGGAWCEVTMEGFVKPVRVEVTMQEYRKAKQGGGWQALWRTHPVTMIENVALRQAHRRACPNECVGYGEEEVAAGNIPAEVVDAEARELPEEPAEVVDAEEVKPEAAAEKVKPEPPPSEQAKVNAAGEAAGEAAHIALLEQLKDEMKRCFPQDGHAAERWLKHHFGSGTSRIGQLSASQAADAIGLLSEIKNGGLKGWKRPLGKGEKEPSEGPKTNGKLFDEAEK